MRSAASIPGDGDRGPDRTANLLGAMALVVADRLVAAAEAAGGSMTRSAAVVLVDQVPRCSVEWLSRRLDLSHSATVRVVDRLTADGLVQRAAGPDARTVALEATAAGSALAAEVKAARLAVLRDVVRDLSDDRRRELVPGGRGIALRDGRGGRSGLAGVPAVRSGCDASIRHARCSMP